MKQTPVVLLSVKYLFQGQNDVTPSTRVESETLRSLVRRSNQLSYAITAKQNAHRTIINGRTRILRH